MKKSQTYIFIIIIALFVGISFGFLLSKASNHTTIILAKHWLEGEEATETVLPDTLGKININTANLNQLCSLPGIGEDTAQKIIDYRETYGVFIYPEDLLNIEGFGKARLNNIIDYIILESGG
jgi:competence ComEA-like helix-hairpin-helix protein